MTGKVFRRPFIWTSHRRRTGPWRTRSCLGARSSENTAGARPPSSLVLGSGRLRMGVLPVLGARGVPPPHGRPDLLRVGVREHRQSGLQVATGLCHDAPDQLDGPVLPSLGPALQQAFLPSLGPALQQALLAAYALPMVLELLAHVHVERPHPSDYVLIAGAQVKGFPQEQVPRQNPCPEYKRGTVHACNMLGGRDGARRLRPNARGEARDHISLDRPTAPGMDGRPHLSSLAFEKSMGEASRPVLRPAKGGKGIPPEAPGGPGANEPPSQDRLVENALLPAPGELNGRRALVLAGPPNRTPPNGRPPRARRQRGASSPWPT